MEGLPRRGPSLRTLGLPVPPGPMPAWRGARPLKRWRYVGAFCPDAMVCVGEVRVGPLPQRFWALAEPGRPIVARTTIGRGGVSFDGARVEVDTREVRISLLLDEGRGVESLHPSGSNGYVWTRKQAGVAVRGEVRAGTRVLPIACEGVVDDTAGYHERHTAWRWSAGVGEGAGGERIGWNLVTGVNDSPRESERAIWVDGEPAEPGPVEFAGDLSSIRFDDGSALRFSEWSARVDRTNVLLLRSSYRQPFGTFEGTLPGGVQLRRGFGVVEEHDVRW